MSKKRTHLRFGSAAACGADVDEDRLRDLLVQVTCKTCNPEAGRQYDDEDEIDAIEADAMIEMGDERVSYLLPGAYVAGEEY